MDGKQYKGPLSLLLKSILAEGGGIESHTKAFDFARPRENYKCYYEREVLLLMSSCLTGSCINVFVPNTNTFLFTGTRKLHALL